MPRQVVTNRKSVTGRFLIPQTQNLVLGSEKMGDPAFWTPNNTTQIPNAITSPQIIGGNLTAAQINETNVTNVHSVYDGGTGVMPLKAGGTYTWSIFTKDGNRGFAGLFIDGGGAGLAKGFMQFSDGSKVSSFTGAFASGSFIVQDLHDNGWFQNSLTFTMGTDIDTVFLQAAMNNSLSTSVVYTGDSSKFVYFTGAQFVKANWPGPYQLTTNSVVNTGNLRNKVSNRNIP